ncbi:OTU domain-containing protein 5 [Sarotherodon galilaeus]
MSDPHAAPPAQPLQFLAQMLAEMAKMSQDQAAAQRDHLAKLQEQADRQTQVLERLVGAAAPPKAPPLSVAVPRMGDGDDPQVFLETFRATAEACQWPQVEWAPRLLPLLSGEAQMAALSLPPTSRSSFQDVSRATARWVRCHRPASLEVAVTLAEDHLAAGAGEPGEGGRKPSRQAPVLAPRRRVPAPAQAERAPALSPTNPFASFVPSKGSEMSSAAPEPRRAAQTPGQECWKCGQPGHLRRDCPLMEVGQVFRVAGAPAPSPGPGGTVGPLRFLVLS